MMTSTAEERRRMRSPSCCATHPATATIGREPSSSTRCFNSPSRVNSFSSARSRTLHVLMTTTSASRSSGVGSYPAWSRRPAMRSESWTFIWQPYVSMKYFRDMRLWRALPLGPSPAGSFAFAFRFVFASRPHLAGLQHLRRARPNGWRDDVAGNHPRHFFLAFGGAKSRDGRERPSLAHGLADVEVRRPVRGDLGQVGNAEYLESIRQTLQTSSHHVRHCPADPGVDLIEDERLAGCVGRRKGLQR